MSNVGVFIGVLGPMQILKMGTPISIRAGGKAEQLVGCLALHTGTGLHRAALVERVWPETPLELAGQCLNTLVHSLKRQLSGGLAGQSPIVHSQGRYTLNLDSGLGVDVVDFESRVRDGHVLQSKGSTSDAIASYEHAVALYRGDVAETFDISGLLERERLRAICLDTLARLADAHFEIANYERALDNATRILAVDPCREDAHRLAMRAFVRLGTRAQALRQYTLCRSILRDEFDAVPELATDRLFNLIRTNPGEV
jgi:DNA-binding SARP family transcriptional activator